MLTVTPVTSSGATVVNTAGGFRGPTASLTSPALMSSVTTTSRRSLAASGLVGRMRATRGIGDVVDRDRKVDAARHLVLRRITQEERIARDRRRSRRGREHGDGIRLARHLARTILGHDCEKLEAGLRCAIGRERRQDSLPERCLLVDVAHGLAKHDLEGLIGWEGRLRRVDQEASLEQQRVAPRDGRGLPLHANVEVLRSRWLVVVSASAAWRGRQTVDVHRLVEEHDDRRRRRNPRPLGRGQERFGPSCLARSTLPAAARGSSQDRCLLHSRLPRRDPRRDRRCRRPQEAAAMRGLRRSSGGR